MMPYILKEQRKTAEHTPLTAGELNFAITRLLLGYLDRKGLNYQTLNDCLGAMEGCKLEFYRRIAVKYEDNARERNGEVYLPTEQIGAHETMPVRRETQ